MSSTSWRTRELLGSQMPRVWCAPSAPTGAGSEVIALAELAGLDLLPWERFVIEQALGQRPDESWAAFVVLLIVARQNGKGSIVEAVELYMLFVLGLNVFHTAHVMKTSRKAFKRLWSLIVETPQLRRRVEGEPHKTAEEIVITLTNGAFIVFMARGQRAGRGLNDCNILILDEALFLDARTVDALVPTMSTNAMPQVWYTSSAGVLGSAVLRKLRADGQARKARMAYFEWSIEPPTKKRPLDVHDRAGWAQANPSLGALISLEYIEDELGLLTEAGFARERLGLFDEDPAVMARVISAAGWAARAGATDRPDGLVAFGVASSWPDASHTSIAVVGWRGGDLVAQVIERRPGTEWRMLRIRELFDRHGAPFVIDPGGPAGDVIGDIAAEELEFDQEPIEVLAPTMRQVGHASKDLLAEVDGETPRLRHFGQKELNDAAAAAGRRTLGDLWTWQRRGEVDISPLEAVTLAAWGVSQLVDYDVPPPLAVAALSSGARSETGELARMGF